MCEHLDFMHYPVDDAVKALGRRWAVPVLLEIMQGQDRFNVLLKHVGGINTRALAARLHEFEKYGLVKRQKIGASPERVHYLLTEKGEEMRQLMREISAFSLKWH